MSGVDVIARLQAAADRHRVVHRGRTVCWRSVGDGPPLLMLHGGHGNWLHWVRNIEPLARHHRLWLPDMPGFGESDDLPGPAHDPDRLQRLLEALTDTLDSLIGAGTPVGLVGFSFGGLVAAALAAHRGAMQRIALLGTGGHGGQRPRDVELADWRLDDPLARRAALRQNLEAFMLHARAAADDLALEVHAQACERTRFRSKALSRAGGLQRALDQAARPLLLIWGAHDVTGVPEDLGPLLTEGRPEREWHIIPAAGHWVQYEQADAVNRRLLDWFAAGGGS